MSQSIFVEINHKCNLNCKHCYNKSSLHSTEMKVTDFRSILNGIEDRKKMSLVISGGEPLLHSEFLKILDISLSSEFNSVIVVTNGTLLKDMLPRIKQYENIHFQISMDGLDGDILLRGQYHFDQVQSAVTYLHQSGYTNGELHMVVTRNNAHEIETFFCYAIENGFFPTYALVYKTGMAVDYWEEIGLTLEESNRINHTIEKLYSDFSYMLSDDNILDISKLLSRQRYRCPLAKELKLSNCLIKTNGDVQPCHALYDAVYCVGNAINTHFSTIIDHKKNPALDRLFTLFILRENMLMDSQCKSCTIKDFCRGGCPAEALSYTGNFLSNDNNCSYKRSNYVLSLIKTGRR